MIKDFTGLFNEEAKELDMFIASLPKPLNLFIPFVEIWNGAREIHSPEEIEKIQEDNPEFNPDESAGEWFEGVLRLFSEAFRISAGTPEESKLEIPKNILCHELGHAVYDSFVELSLIDVDQWDQVRKADGDERRIFSDYAIDLIGIYGFSHEKTQSEDFAESFRYSLMNPKEFAEEFPNRAEYCKEIIIYLTWNKVPDEAIHRGFSILK